jgi:hypothetical protein
MLTIAASLANVLNGLGGIVKRISIYFLFFKLFLKFFSKKNIRLTYNISSGRMIAPPPAGSITRGLFYL